MTRALRHLVPALALLGWATGAGAQTVTGFQGQSCAGTRAGRDLACTSRDFTTSAHFTQPPPGIATCTAGSEISVDVLLDIASNSPTRYDGAIFMGEVGNDPSVRTAGESCSLGLFPSTPFPFLDVDTDAVGDFAGGQVGKLTITGVKVTCVPSPGTNVLGLPYAVVFDNKANPGADHTNVTAATNAKCVSSVAAQVTGVVVQGWIELTALTDPPGDPQAFTFATSGTTTATPATFTLTDGSTRRVEVPLSPTGGTESLTVQEVAVPGWNPTATTLSCTDPSGAPAPYVTVDAATRTITATLDAARYGAICTIRNEKYARITVEAESLGATGSFGFVDGTNGLPASLTLDTAAQNPARATYVVGANATAAAISRTPVPAGWSFDGATCRAGATVLGTFTGATATLSAADVTPGREITCTFRYTRHATLTKAFNPTATGNGVPAQLVFTVQNRPGAPAQSGFGFTDTLPAGLTVAAPLAVVDTCGGSLTGDGGAPLAAGHGVVTLAGSAMAAGVDACQVIVAVSAPTPGAYVNGPGQLSAVSSLDVAVTDQTLTVYWMPSLLIVKSADRGTARPGDVVTYTLVVSNSGLGPATAVELRDPLSRYVAFALDAFGPGVPFLFQEGIPASGLVPGTPVYSDDGGLTWTLVPGSGGGGAPAGHDARVTAWRLPLAGTMAAGGSFTLAFKVVVR